jgi:hypothetical protein
MGVIMKRFKGMLAGAGALALIGASNAHAALDFTGITVNTADVEAVMGIVIVGLVALWGFRKVIKTINRS